MKGFWPELKPKSGHTGLQGLVFAMFAFIGSLGTEVDAHGKVAFWKQRISCYDTTIMVAEETHRTTGSVNGAQAGSVLDEDLRLKKLVSEHHRLNLRIEELEHELECLQESISWRVTTPLRHARPWIGRLRRIFSFGKHVVALNPFSDLIFQDELYTITGPVPYFVLESSKGRMPCGQILVRFSERSSTGRLPEKLRLYADSGRGFSEEVVFTLDPQKRVSQVIQLPDAVRTLRLDPACNDTKTFSMPEITISEVSTFAVLRSKFWERLQEEKELGGSTLIFVNHLLATVFSGGLCSLKQRILGHEFSSLDFDKLYRRWIARREQLSAEELLEFRQKSEGFAYKPLISVLMPVYNTPEKWLRLAIESVLGQAYQNWELCIADDASTRPSVRDVLEEYKLRDSRIKVVYRPVNEHISASSNTALDLCEGEFVALMDHDDELAPHALFEVAQVLNNEREIDLIFSDEDRITARGVRRDPYFKQGWDPVRFLGQNLISHLGVYRTEVAKKVRFRKGFEGSQDWDFALRFVEASSPEKIRHISKVLYHWRLIPGAVSFTAETKIDAFSAAERAVSEHIERIGRRAEVKQGGSCIEVMPLLTREMKVFVHCVGDMQAPAELVSGGSTFIQQVSEISEADVIVIASAPLAQESELQHLLAWLESPSVAVACGRVLASDGTIDNLGFQLSSNDCLRKRWNGLPGESAGAFAGAVIAQEVAIPSACFLACKRQCIDVDAVSTLTSAQSVLNFALDLAVIAAKKKKKIVVDPRFTTIASSEMVAMKVSTVKPELQELLELRCRELQNTNLDSANPGYALAFSKYA